MLRFYIDRAFTLCHTPIIETSTDDFKRIGTEGEMLVLHRLDQLRLLQQHEEAASASTILADLRRIQFDEDIQELLEYTASKEIKEGRSI